MYRMIILFFILLSSIFVVLPAQAISQSNEIVGTITRNKNSAFNNYALTAQGDIIVTYKSKNGKRFKALAQDAQTNRAQRFTLANERTKLRFDDFNMMHNDAGQVLVWFLYRNDPVMHYNVWDGSQWKFTESQTMQLNCGNMVDGQAALTGKQNILYVLTAKNCLAGDNKYEHQFLEFDFGTMSWNQIDSSGIDSNEKIFLYSTAGYTFIGQYFSIGDQHSSQPDSVLWISPPGQNLTRYTIPHTSHTGKSMLVRTIRGVAYRSDGSFVAIADRAYYDSKTNTTYHLEDVIADETQFRSLGTIQEVRTDATDNVVMTIDWHDRADHLYQWNGTELNIIDLGVDDSTAPENSFSGVQDMATLSDGRLLMTVHSAINQYVVVWNGTHMSEPELLNKKYMLASGFRTASIITSFQDKPYAIIVYGQWVKKKDRTFQKVRAWTQDGLQSSHKTSGNLSAIDNQSNGLHTLLSKSVTKNNGHKNLLKRFYTAYSFHVWDTRNHKIIKTVRAGRIHVTPQQVQSYQWDFLTASVRAAKKKKPARFKLRLKTIHL